VRKHLDEGPGLLIADLDLDEVASVRRSIPVLANRRL
jgi:predicted amidohydrolase